MSRDYITIAEYAKIKGVSTSAVYKRLKTTLQPFYVEVEGGKKALKREILDFEGFEVENLSTPNSSTLPQQVVENSSTPSQPLYLNELLQEKDKKIEELQKELAAARQLIKEKDIAISENNKKITETNDKLLELLEQSQELQRNNQFLMAKQQEIKQLEDGKKAGFFSRLFRRDRDNKE